jgi:hypothetical protein
MIAATRSPAMHARTVGAAPTADLDADGPIIEPPPSGSTAEEESEDDEGRAPAIEPAAGGPS